MLKIKKIFKPVYILTFLLTVSVGLAMIYLNIHSEKLRQSESDFSNDWIYDDTLVDVDTVVTSRGIISLSKQLPENISFNDSLCFISLNSFFDLYIDDELVYSYTQPANFTGYGYGTAYHAVNLSPDQAGKTVRIDMRSAFSSRRNGRIRMISLENAQNYFSRFARGQMFSFIISAGISLIGFLLLIFRIGLRNNHIELDIVSLAITAIIAGTWMAVDTGFLRLTANAITVSRNLNYICMHLCFLPLVIFIYSATKERNKYLLLSIYIVSGIYFIVVLTARFLMGIDMAKNAMIRFFFIYALAMIILSVIMIIKDQHYCRNNSIYRKMDFFYIGIGALVVCILTDVVIYVSGVRSVSGYATFSRVGCYVFFLSMGIEIIRTWARDYSALRKYGFVDELTGLGNRRAFVRFENEHKDKYPYGYVISDINALKKANDTYGHERGDELIQTVADRLSEVFGKHNVFRIGGDEFVAYCFAPTAGVFEATVQKAINLLSDKDASASIGGAYAADSSSDLQLIKKKAEEYMYNAKELYYINSEDRRR
ncbi:MAG: GGDEF domain-containing protein [Lachnospiraceae bacterium]|nr:GGDEF domain-containing protein [Lachnospiraceae bacterium]